MKVILIEAYKLDALVYGAYSLSFVRTLYFALVGFLFRDCGFKVKLVFNFMGRR